jgi:hypothetical protein
MAIGFLAGPATSFAPPWPFRVELSNQSGKHQFQFSDPVFQRFILGRGQELEVATQQKEVIQFAGRSEGKVQKLPQFNSSCPPAAFCYVRGNRIGSAPHLTDQPVSFVFGKGIGRSVDTQDHGMAFLPDRQLAKVLHTSAPFIPPRFNCTHYLRLITYNSGQRAWQCL